MTFLMGRVRPKRRRPTTYGLALSYCDFTAPTTTRYLRLFLYQVTWFLRSRKKNKKEKASMMRQPSRGHRANCHERWAVPTHHRAVLGRGLRCAKRRRPRSMTSKGWRSVASIHAWGFAYLCTLLRAAHRPRFMMASRSRYPVYMSRLAPVCLAEWGGPNVEASPRMALPARRHHRRYLSAVGKRRLLSEVKAMRLRMISTECG